MTLIRSIKDLSYDDLKNDMNIVILRHRKEIFQAIQKLEKE